LVLDVAPDLGITFRAPDGWQQLPGSDLENLQMTQAPDAKKPIDGTKASTRQPA
jgi:hypothetical protein